MVSGSCVFSASSPPCGMLNGLWLKSTCPVSSFSSNIGKSVIQQNRNAPVSPRLSSSASRVRTAPANLAAVSTLPATKNTASPAARPQVGADRLGAVGFQVARDRPLRAVRLVDDVAQPAGALGPRPVVQLVEEAARLRRGTRRRDRAHHPARGGDAREQTEARAGEVLRHIADPQRIAQVRLVGAVFQHRRVVRDAAERQRVHRAALGEFLEHAGDHRFDRGEHVLLRHVAHLEVELVELARRAVGARGLVAEARRDLEVAVEARHHRQLLELLRRLRQRVELARDAAAPAPGSRARPRGCPRSGSASGTR